MDIARTLKAFLSKRSSIAQARNSNYSEFGQIENAWLILSPSKRSGNIMSDNSTVESYLDLGKTGSNTWWRYFLGFLCVVGSYIVGNVIALIAMIVANSGKMITMDRHTGEIFQLDSKVIFVEMHLMFASIVVGVWIAVRFLHNRPFHSLLTTAKTLNLGRFLFGLFVWFSLCIVMQICTCLIYPGSVHLSLQVTEFFYFLPLVLVFTPLQTFAEEIAFRGYLLQAIGSIFKNGWLAAAVNGVLFALPHLWTPGLPQPIVMALDWILTGRCYYSHQWIGSSGRCALGKQYV